MEGASSTYSTVVDKMQVSRANIKLVHKRVMQAAFNDQIGKNVEVYINDLVVKSKRKDDLVPDLAKTCSNLHQNKIMLNPMKCVFGVVAGKILVFLVSHHRIEVKLHKIDAINKIKSPTTICDI